MDSIALAGLGSSLWRWRGRETAAAASGAGGVGGEPLLYALRVEPMLTPSQHPNSLSLHELRQANGTLSLSPSQLHPS